ncbi:zinc-binding dehydrogenase [Streptomyces sp. NRRL F-5126]|uniref:zinc-binding dehydrogenase n=1 Tax=Streptomyces sp. NRRL F-5126 TaxID=1463857 RepID=UPI000A815B0F|nr:zinc-binding dehydrogenase [Streptomyces sp. NRRL F-5126]
MHTVIADEQGTSTMRAIVLRQYGSPEELRLEEVPDPVAGPGEVVVDVAAAGIQFVETQVRSGGLRGVSPVAPKELPWRPGREVAGVVASVGEGADPALIGQRVAGQTATGGGYAERAVLAVSAVHRLPQALGSAEAVSLLGTGRTAVALLETARIGKGDTVLVESAAGAVGTLVLQLARDAGAERLIGLARGEEKLRLVREFGADEAVDYTAPGWPDQVRQAAPDGVTVVLDAVGGRTGLDAFELLAPGGRFVIFGFSGGSITRLDPASVSERGITVSSYFGPPTGDRGPDVQMRQTREALTAAAEGRLRPLVGQRFPLAEASAAHTAISARATVGKTVLIP